jgi:hypothetical protein
MDNKNLRIIIDVDHKVTENDLNLHYTLADTIEARGMGENYFEINVELDSIAGKVEEVESILQSLGFSSTYKIIIGDLEN